MFLSKQQYCLKTETSLKLGILTGDHKIFFPTAIKTKSSTVFPSVMSRSEF